jgi:hypothetical protein
MKLLLVSSELVQSYKNGLSDFISEALMGTKAGFL